MTTKARLRYENSSNNMETIGVHKPDDPLSGTISTFTIDEDAQGYKRVIIEGDPDLQDNMPVVDSDFGSSEPEILVQVDKNNDGTWTDRLRVQPEGGGTTDDRGRYKHKKLYGFKKETGEDDVVISNAITSDIEAVLEEALPSGYTAVYPSDKTAPSVNEFTFSDSRQQLYNDLQTDYDHVIIFTPNTDGSGNYKVKLQPVGYGSRQFSLERGKDPWVYDYYRPQDTSQIVSKVNITGTTPNGVAIDETYTPADFSGMDSAERSRYRHVRVPFLGGTESEAKTEAKNIAETILNPKASDNLALDTELRTDRNLNQTVGLLDDSRSIDADYTVIRQKDFLHEGITYLSFEFENDATKSEIRRAREHDSQERRIYPSDTRGVGDQGVTTDDAKSNTAKDGGVGDDNDRNDDLSNVTKGGEVLTTLPTLNTKQESDSATVEIDGNWNFMTSTPQITNDDVLFHAITIAITDMPSGIDLEVAVEGDDEFVVFHDTMQQVGNYNHDSITGGTLGDDGYYKKSFIITPIEWSGSDTSYALYMADKGGGTPQITASLTVQAITHSHDDNITADDNSMGLTDDVGTVDNNHGGGTGDDQHGGSTDSKDINVITENNTGR